MLVASFADITSSYISEAGWLGWVMVLGSFQCRGVPLLLHTVRQVHALLAAGAGRVGYICFYIFHLSFLSNVLSFGRRLNMTDILWFWLLNPNGSCQLLPRCPRLVLVNRLDGLSLPRNSATNNGPARHDLVVDWAVKRQHMQTKIFQRNYNINLIGDNFCLRKNIM